ncbi:MAG: glycosyltransferase family 2 protein [Spirochaetaceae bacterium]|jgi:dolichol-phosphate mannosyltransferase|nr:glycosyltransferase family 2 protein [Spirochaetaceae bacterium]
MQEAKIKNREHDDASLGFLASPRLLVAIPTYNEAENIELFVKTVFEYIPANAEILVIDDNSPDGTAQLVEKLILNYQERLHIIKRPGKQGGASAFLESFSWGLEHGFDGILAMDADFSHDPQFIPHFLDARKNYDFVIGSRLVSGGRIENRSFMRDLLSKSASLYCRILLGCGIRDWTGGYNFWSKKALEKINIASIVTRGYSFQLEMKYKAVSRGCSAVEIPIVFPERKHGVSKMPPSFLLKALADVWRIRFICVNESIQQFIKFAVTGGLGTITNLAIFFLCVDKLAAPEIPVSIGCFLIAGTQNYIINHKWSFARNTEKTPLSVKKWGAFLCASLLGLAVNIVVMQSIIHHVILPYKFIAQACGIVCGMMLNFIISKLFVFRRK